MAINPGMNGLGPRTVIVKLAGAETTALVDAACAKLALEGWTIVGIEATKDANDDPHVALQGGSPDGHAEGVSLGTTAADYATGVTLSVVATFVNITPATDAEITAVEPTAG
jgi:hypothetical protein